MNNHMVIYRLLMGLRKKILVHLCVHVITRLMTRCLRKSIEIVNISFVSVYIYNTRFKKEVDF